MRLFVAVNLPQKEKARLIRAAAPLQKAELPVRWSAPEALHLTMKFLGEVRPEYLPAIEMAVARAASKSRPFQVKLGGVGAFPTPRRPRVIWMGVEATPELRCLKQDLEWELAPLGFEREMRAFQPHLTLGRVEANAAAGAFRELDVLAQTVRYSGTLRVSTVELMRSHTSAKGARYESLMNFRLSRSVAARGDAEELAS